MKNKIILPLLLVSGIGFIIAIYYFMSLKYISDTSRHEISWHKWTPEIFQKAKQEKKIILLHLSADWCPYCQKMKKTTWQDQRIIDTINIHFIPVKIQDETDPQLAKKFRSYGRPATIFYDENQTELIRKTGFIKPQWMHWTLLGVVQDYSSKDK